MVKFWVDGDPRIRYKGSWMCISLCVMVGLLVLFHLVLYRVCMVVLDTLLVSGFVWVDAICGRHPDIESIASKSGYLQSTSNYGYIGCSRVQGAGAGKQNWVGHFAVVGFGTTISMPLVLGMVGVATVKYFGLGGHWRRTILVSEDIGLGDESTSAVVTYLR